MSAHDQPGADEIDLSEQFLARVREADKARGDLVGQLEEATAELREAIVAADRGLPGHWGWRSTITANVTSLSAGKVSDAFLFGEQLADTEAALRSAEIPSSSVTCGTGRISQVVITLAKTGDEASALDLAGRVVSALLAKGLSLAPAAVRTPTRTSEEQQQALAELADGKKVAVIDARPRRQRSQGSRPG